MSTPEQNNAEVSHVEPDDIGVGMLTVLGSLCAVALLLIVVLLQAWFYNWKDDLAARRTASMEEQSAPAAIAADQLKKIESYGWADKEKHIRTIPISRAMELIVQEYGEKKEMNTILPLAQVSLLATDGTRTEHGYEIGGMPGKPACPPTNPCLFRVSSVAAVLLCCAVALPASTSLALADDITPGVSAEAHIVLKPDAQAPLDLQFRDETGKTVKLGDYFRPNRPVVLSMVYFGCKALCGPALNGLTNALRKVGLQPGEQFEIVTVSFNPAEGPDIAAGKKENYLKALGKPEFAPAWHFLTSSDPSAAKALGDAIGFGYRRTPKGDYLHDAGIYVCTPEGRVSRVQQGVLFDSVELHDSLINASQGKISTGLFGAGLSCGLFNFDAASGKYTLAAVAIMRITGIATVLAVAGGIAWMVYRENRRKITTSAEPAIQQP